MKKLTNKHEIVELIHDLLIQLIDEKTAKWEMDLHSDSDDVWMHYHCSNCGANHSDLRVPLSSIAKMRPYCEKCGAYMKGEEDG